MFRNWFGPGFEDSDLVVGRERQASCSPKSRNASTNNGNVSDGRFSMTFIGFVARLVAFGILGLVAQKYFLEERR